MSAAILVTRGRAVRRIVAAGAFASIAMSTACMNWGVRPEDFPPAVSPVGAHVAVRVRGEDTDRTGELYAVDTGGVVVRSARLIRVRWSHLAAMDLHDLRSEFDVSFNETPDAAKRARLAMVSRFPQGLSGDLLRRVLAILDQPAIEEIP